MKEVQGYINQKGYNYLLHNTIQENSQIIKLDYQYSVPITKKVNIQKYNKCLSYIFNILEKDLKKGILMRYKRVSNYNYNDAVDSLITEMAKQDIKRGEIYEGSS